MTPMVDTTTIAILLGLLDRLRKLIAYATVRHALATKSTSIAGAPMNPTHMNQSAREIKMPLGKPKSVVFIFASWSITQRAKYQAVAKAHHKKIGGIRVSKIDMTHTPHA